MRQLLLAGVLLIGALALPTAQSASADAYTHFDLLDPATSRFRVVTDVSATTPGARFYFDRLCTGADGAGHEAVDRMTGRALPSAVVTGPSAREDGVRDADPRSRYLKVTLARPVPQGGETRLRLVQTCQDPAAYGVRDGVLSFDRVVEAARQAIVLPAGFDVASMNVPVQVLEEADGRLRLSHWHTHPGPTSVALRARRRAAVTPVAPVTSPAVMSPGTPASPPRNELANLRVSERAMQDREIVYFLQPPETHSFRLYHDYTESRPGVATYRNVVRGGSTVSDPSAVLLDTGESLKVETTREKDAEVVVIHFPAVQPGQSARLRITETYTDPGRYGLVDGQLVWNRNFGRPVNDVVLPPGWYLTDSAVPGVITTEPDGRTRIAFINPRPDSIDVVLKARRR